jgi:hypothetical protein
MLTAGTILLDKKAPRPDWFRWVGDAGPAGWITIRHGRTPQDLDRDLAVGGWSFFSMAGSIRKTGWGGSRTSAMRQATTRVIAAAQQRGCNGLEIDDVVSRSGLGITFITIAAHARHLQNQAQKGAPFVAA